MQYAVCSMQYLLDEQTGTQTQRTRSDSRACSSDRRPTTTTSRASNDDGSNIVIQQFEIAGKPICAFAERGATTRRVGRRA